MLSKQYFTAILKERTVPNSCCYPDSDASFCPDCRRCYRHHQEDRKGPSGGGILPWASGGRGCPGCGISVRPGLFRLGRENIAGRRHAAVAYRRGNIRQGGSCAHGSLPQARRSWSRSAGSSGAHRFGQKFVVSRRTSRSLRRTGSNVEHRPQAQLASRPAASGDGARSQVRDQDHQR